jgi:hypothetical protein
MSVEGVNWDGEGDDGGRLRVLLDQYRALLYTFGAAALLAVLGAVIDATAGPLTDDTELAHQIAGLLGAASLALGICLLLVMALWGILVLTNR